MPIKRRALGRSLKDILSKLQQKNMDYKEVEISKIKLSPFRMRERVENIDELADSIKSVGVLQPVILRKKADDEYEIIAGQRRLVAAKQAGLLTIPALIKEVDNPSSLLMALVENIQRQDMTPIEEACVYKILNEEFGMTHEEIAQKVAKDRATVTNTLRLLDLPDYVKKYIQEGRIDISKAKLLLSILEDQELLQKAVFLILNDKLSTSQLDGFIKSAKQTKEIRPKEIDENLKKLEEELTSHLEFKVTIKQLKGEKGKIIIEYNNQEELQRIKDILLRI